MGAVEDAVDAAANFIGPFVTKNKDTTEKHEVGHGAPQLVDQALSHLQTINTADLAADPDAPYDASLAGVVYGLLDLVTCLGILSQLSPGVAFSHRPRSVLTHDIDAPPSHDATHLAKIIELLLPIQRQERTGLQPLVSQRVLPDIISALAELAFSPSSNDITRRQYLPIFNNTLSSTPTSRLLPILTTFLQQSLPSWLKPTLSKELAMVPLRSKGIRHTIEFLSLSHLSKNGQVPQDASGPQRQIPIPLEAISQASRLLSLPPVGITQDQWLQDLAPQLWALVDGDQGRELSRAAGQIIAGGILSKKSTGAPGTCGWSLFAEPLIQCISPKDSHGDKSGVVADSTIVDESAFKMSLRRLAVIVSSYSHAGLLRRLTGPILLPLWALLNYVKIRPSLDKEWTVLPQTILMRYMTISCDAKEVDGIATNLFWDGGSNWTFGSGAQGGVEIRRRAEDHIGSVDVEGIFARIKNLDARVQLLVSLLHDSTVTDEVTGAIFLQTSRRWLSIGQVKRQTLVADDEDPLAALADAKLSQALAVTFKEQFARKPQHIIGLMDELLQNFVHEHQEIAKSQAKSGQPSRANLSSIVSHQSPELDLEDSDHENIVSFAISILSTLVSSANFSQTPETRMTLASTITPLVYLSEPQPGPPIAPLLTTSATELLHLLQPRPAAQKTEQVDPLAEHRLTLQAVMADLTSPDPPNRTWALSQLRSLITDPAAYSVVNVPSITHMLLSASLADPESYVHTAAIPVIVDLAVAAPNPVFGILVDAFVDIDERSLKLSKGKQTDEKSRELQEALDFRLRVGEVLSKIVVDDDFWSKSANLALQYRCVKQITEACLSLASRRGQRKQTLQARTQLLDTELREQEESEAAWGGPIPNLLAPEGDNPQDEADRDALLKTVQGWENTGVEEDLRVRASALSVLSSVLEHRLEFSKQVFVDAALHMSSLILTLETGEAKAIVRRAAMLVFMGLLRACDVVLDSGKQVQVGLDMKQEEEVKRIGSWVRDEDVDDVVRDHASSVVQGLETLRTKKLYRLKDEGLKMGHDLGLVGHLRGLDVRPNFDNLKGRNRNRVIEEVE